MDTRNVPGETRKIHAPRHSCVCSPNFSSHNLVFWSSERHFALKQLLSPFRATARTQHTSWGIKPLKMEATRCCETTATACTSQNSASCYKPQLTHRFSKRGSRTVISLSRFLVLSLSSFFFLAFKTKNVLNIFNALRNPVL